MVKIPLFGDNRSMHRATLQCFSMALLLLAPTEQKLCHLITQTLQKQQNNQTCLTINLFLMKITTAKKTDNLYEEYVL